MSFNKKFQITIITAAAISGLIFLGILATVVTGAGVPNLDAIDEKTLTAIKEVRTPALNTLMSIITALGGTIFLTAVSVLLALIPTLRKKIGGLVVPTLILASATNTLLKNLIQRPRPTIIPQLASEPTFSFPSGHSICSTVFYLLLAFAVFTITKNTKNKATKNLLIALSLIFTILPFFIAFSRVYLGVHYPSDVLAGVFLGLSFVFARLLLLSIKKI